MLKKIRWDNVDAGNGSVERKESDMKNTCKRWGRGHVNHGERLE